MPSVKFNKKLFMPVHDEDIHISSSTNVPTAQFAFFAPCEKTTKKTKLIKPLFDSQSDSSFFPHYGFSFYDHPPGPFISTVVDDIPGLYVSNILFNFGSESLLFQTNATVCNDKAPEGPVCFFIGSMEQLTQDVVCTSTAGLSVKRPDSHQGHLLAETIDQLYNTLVHNTHKTGVTSQSVLPTKKPGHKPDDQIEDSTASPNQDRIQEIKILYQELEQVNTIDESGYLDFIYLTAGMLTSVRLSFTTTHRISEDFPPELMPVYQIPINPDQYFSDPDISEPENANQNECTGTLWYNQKKFLLHPIVPGLYCHSCGIFFDLFTRTVTGKRKQISRFLWYLNKKKLLANMDLNYLI